MRTGRGLLRKPAESCAGTSFSFQSTAIVGFMPPTQQDWGLPAAYSVEDDDAADAYALIEIELDWKTGATQRPVNRV